MTAWLTSKRLKGPIWSKTIFAEAFLSPYIYIFICSFFINVLAFRTQIASWIRKKKKSHSKSILLHLLIILLLFICHKNNAVLCTKKCLKIRFLISFFWLDSWRPFSNFLFLQFWFSYIKHTYVLICDGFELTFSKPSQAELNCIQAELGCSNFRAENEPTRFASIRSQF